VTELRSKLVYHIGQLYEEVTAFLTTLLPTDAQARARCSSWTAWRSCAAPV
jgi:hypothetical protein